MVDTELLDAALESAWRLIGRGAADRRSPLHTPVVATIRDGLPQARVMVLRAADRSAARLRFHTDARSPKCAELDGQPVTILGYHPGEAVQLRLSGTARVIGTGPDVDRIWTQSTPFARRCYMVEAAPGSPLPGPGSGLPANVDGRKPEEPELIPARANFAIVEISITEIDWLHLAQTGHRRAAFAAADGWHGKWRVP